MQFFARLEAYGFAGSYAYFGSGAGISADSGFARADAEDAKSAQFDALAGGQSLLQALEYRIHGGFRLGARQARAPNYLMYDVLLNQKGTLAGATGLNVLRQPQPMLLLLLRMAVKGIIPLICSPVKAEQQP
jgi:hypothetical protein